MKRNLLMSIMVAFALLLSVGTASAVPIGQLGILDDNANGGINPVTGLAWASGDQYRLVFVTSTFGSPGSSNINDYNAFVQAAANSAGLGAATWNVIGSTTSVDARDNTGTNFTIDPIGTSIFLIDGTTKIADDYTDLWDGTIDSPINRTETNGAYTPPLTSPFGQFGGVWAGTTGDGQDRGVAALGGPRADLGLSIVSNSAQWIRRADINPHNDAPLGFYAMSELLTIPGNAVPEPTTATLGLIGLAGLLARRRRAA